MQQKQYNALFFDVDGTLLDFDAAEREALGLLLRDRGIEIREEYIQCYHHINASMWKMLERGEITREKLQSERFVQFFDAVGLKEKADGEENRIYRNYLSQAAIPIAGAQAVLQELGSRYPLYVVSNGNTQVQYGRLGICGFQKYFRQIFLSEEIGYTKPDKRFFEECLRQLPDMKREEILLIGDSLSSDMAGGRNAGIDTCWYNPTGILRDETIPVTYEIQDLRELCALLE
ncbi:MAG: YjjG family noncanonical pyrimidine nucleotidase [bacterium]|nr:YjjG family noncanonical pyrimidine nucleotidase [bacterium]